MPWMGAGGWSSNDASNRDTPGGRAYLDLQNQGRRERRPTQELLDGEHLPPEFADVVSAVIRFVDPLVAGDVSSWDPDSRSWS